LSFVQEWRQVAINITIVCGSQRPSSESAKVAGHVGVLLARHHPESPVRVLDLGRSPLPWWSDDFRVDGSDAARRWAPTAALLGATDGFVIVTPEWGGMSPPALKNLFLLCDGSDELADKPALLVGVSSSGGGAYAVAELRASSYKNTRICYIPEQVMVRNVCDLFAGDALVESQAARDVESRLVHGLALLVGYAEALVAVRRSGIRDSKRFGYGM